MNKVKLSEISNKISSGLTPLRSKTEFWEHGTIPWLKTEQLGEREIYDTTEYISEKALQSTGIRLNPANSLSIAMYGEGKTRGNVSILKLAMTTNQACCNIVIDSTKANYEYVYYFLKTQYNNLRGMSSGVRKNLNSDNIKNYIISLPETIEIQNKIAHVLSTLDKKIEINNKINKELEKMAKTLYDYWFVQFDFPDENGKPYKSSGGKMVYNQELKREIPVGWEVCSLSEIESNIITGKTPPTAKTENYGDEIPFITIADIRNNTFITKYEQKLSKIGADSQNNKYLPQGSLCISCIATVGLIGFTTESSQTNQQINSIIFQNEENKAFLYFALNNYFKSFAGAKTGATFDNMNKGEFSSIKLIEPNSKQKLKFSSSIKHIFSQIENNHQQNLELTKLRDWLLPMLMNGQVKVK